MPFASESQRRYLFSQAPAVARKFAAHTPRNAKLPEYAPPKLPRKARKK